VGPIMTPVVSRAVVAAALADSSSALVSSAEWALLVPKTTLLRRNRTLL